MVSSTEQSSFQKPAITVVTTLYRSSSYLLEFYKQTLDVLNSIKCTYEIVLVNDGSPDDSLKIATDIASKDSNVVVVDLSRNFGQHHAILAGLEVAKGELIFLIDSDLEEPPSCLLDFYNYLQDNPDTDVIYGVQAAQRKGGLAERLSGAIFYKLFNCLSETNISENICSARLMRSNYVTELLNMGDSNLFLGGQFAWLGFKQVAQPIKKLQIKEQSSYSLSKKINLLINAIISFSSYPIRLVFYIGTILFALSFTFSVYILINKLLNPEISAGWSSIMVSIWLIGSLIILFLGVIGIYISKIFNEVKQRQRFIIRSIYRNKGNQ